MIKTTDGTKAIENLEIGDTLSVPSQSTVKLDDNASNFELTEKIDFVDAKIAEISSKTGTTVSFNANTDLVVSETQPLLVSSNNEIKPVLAQDIKIGDKIVKVSDLGDVIEVEVTSIEKSDKEVNLFMIMLDNGSIFLANNYIILQ